MLKKLIAIVLCFALIAIPLTACTSDKENEPTQETLGNVSTQPNDTVGKETTSPTQEHETSETEATEQSKETEPTESPTEPVTEPEEVDPESTLDMSDVNLNSLIDADITINELLQMYDSVKNDDNYQRFSTVEMDAMTTSDEFKEGYAVQSITVDEDHFKQNEKFVREKNVSDWRIYMNVNGELKNPETYYDESEMRADKTEKKLYMRESSGASWKTYNEDYDPIYGLSLKISVDAIDESDLKVQTDGRYYVIIFNAPVQVLNMGELYAATDPAIVYIIFNKNCSAMSIRVVEASVDFKMGGLAATMFNYEGSMADGHQLVATLNFEMTKSFFGEVQDKEVAIPNHIRNSK